MFVLGLKLQLSRIRCAYIMSNLVFKLWIWFTWVRS